MLLGANMDGKSPPFFRVTDDDQGGIAVVVALNVIIVSSLVCGIRALVAVRQHIGFQADDVTFYIAGVSLPRSIRTNYFGFSNVL